MNKDYLEDCTVPGLSLHKICLYKILINLFLLEIPTCIPQRLGKHDKKKNYWRTKTNKLLGVMLFWIGYMKIFQTYFLQQFMLANSVIRFYYDGLIFIKLKVLRRLLKYSEAGV